MQRHKKLSARILSMALSVAMVATMMPATVFAAEGDVPLGASSLGTSSIGTIRSFDKLEDRFEPSTGEEASEHIYGLAVELDTPYEDLELPTELTAMVKRTTTTVSTPSDAEDTEDTVPDHQPASPSDAEEEVTEEIEDEDVPLAPEPEQDEETTVTTTEQETISVTWNSDKEYKSDENGKFVYTAVLPEGYILADGVKLPQIYVMVGRQARAEAPSEIVVGGDNATTGYETADAATLKKAIAEISVGGTVKIGADISLGATDVETGHTFTLDLNGKTISYNGGNFSPAIRLVGDASLTVTDSSGNGKISASNQGGTVIRVTSGTLTVSNGILETTGKGAMTIVNISTGTINVSGGTVLASGEAGYAISNDGGGTVNISGGTVSTSDSNGVAIYNKTGTGKVSISGTATITSACTSATKGSILINAIPSSPSIVLEIKDTATVGNTAEPEGYSVYFSPKSLDPANIGNYYSHTGGTVGKVHPAAAAISVTINGTAYAGSTLQDAISKLQGGSSVTSLKVTAGKVTEADWNYLKSLTALTTFEIADDAVVTDVANIPHGLPDVSIFPPSIVTITVPQAITIGNYAFKGCSALTTVNFPKATRIAVCAFEGCTALTSVSFPAVTFINLSAFSGCTALTTASFPKVTGIELSAFKDCTKLATLKLGATPPGVGTNPYGGSSFTNCPATRALGYLNASGTALTGDALTAAQAAYKAKDDGNTGDGLWYGWTIAAPKLMFTAKIDGVETALSGDSLTAALNGKDLSKVTELKITAGEVIEDDWNYLKNLTAMTTFEIDSGIETENVANIPNVQMGTSLFPKSITSVTVPQAITIGECAFFTCLSLASADFPAATSIGSHAFAYCANLMTANFHAVTSIGAGAFVADYILTIESFPAATSIGIGAFRECTALSTVSFPKVTSIGDGAFASCTTLATLNLPAAPPSVGTDAFLDCLTIRTLGYLKADGTALTGTDLATAQAAYKAKDDGDTTDDLWYGWTIVSTASTHKPVTNITGVPTTAVAGTDLTLTGTVAPTDATNKTIVWSVKSAGATNATITGSTLKTTAAGTVTVTATITNGLTASSNYTQDFTITVNVPKTPSSIAVTTPPTKTAYTTGQTFDKTGMVVTATYTDSTTAAVSGYTFSPTTALAASDTTITISYTENGTTVTTTQTITVTDAPATHTITASASAGGSISPSGTVTVNNGESKTFIISANSNYSISSVSVDGVNQGAITTYTFSNVTGNHTISAIFSYNGGGGGSSSDSQTIYTSVPPNYTGGTKIIGNVRVPDYTVEGAWKKNANGTWNFSGKDGKAYANSWAPVFNPYADVAKGQSAFDWFMFDANGIMRTGWYTDTDGNTYYLNPTSDNTLGAMQTGWVLIDGKYYYFNETLDGTRGKLFKNTRTPDGYLVDENGVWIGTEKQ